MARKLDGNYITANTITTTQLNLVGDVVVPGMQLTVRNVIVGANSTATQSILGVGVTLASNTVYSFFGNFNFFKTAGGTSHTMSFGFGGTATIHSITNNILVQDSGAGYTPANPTSRRISQYVPETANFVVLTDASALAFRTINFQMQGIVRITTGGTFIPQYQLSAAPGGAYTHSTHNFMGIYPVGTGTGNVTVGTWT